MQLGLFKNIQKKYLKSYGLKISIFKKPLKSKGQDTHVSTQNKNYFILFYFVFPDEDIGEDLDDNEDEDMERICVNYNLRRLRKLNLSFIGSNQQNLDNPSLLCSAESNKLAETNRQTDHRTAENFHHFNIHLLIYRHCSRNTNL